jgi:serine/threonine-protein kinase
MSTRSPAPAVPRDPGKLGEQATTLGGRGWSASVSEQTGSVPRLSKVCPACLEHYPLDFRVCPRDATELQDAAVDEDTDSLIGAVLGETFSIVRVVGEGGMARVYEARHVRLPNKRFAVKVLHPHYAQQSMVVARFQREAEAASGIVHPNVVDVFDVGYAPDGRPYLVSEFLEGKDFATLLEERQRIEPAAAVHVVRQVCRALAAAHARGVVHRDVKPENVFLVGDMEAPVVKVLDFGISKVDGTGGATLTHTGMIMGTPGYMPPEQARGAKTDHRADIYGVGAMLYRAVTGKLPFESEDASEALSMVLTQEPRRPRVIEPSIPAALELVIETAMAKDPEARYRSMAELDEKLAAFEPDVAASLSLAPPPPGSVARRGKTTVAAATVRSPSAGDIERDTREAKLARPTILTLTIALYAWIAGCLIDSGAAAFAFMRGAASVTPTEKVIVTTIVLLVSLTPVVFWIRHVGSTWGNSVRSVELARLLRRIVLWATVPYGFLALAIRVLAPLTDPRLLPVVPAVSLAFAAFGYLGARLGAWRRRGST